MYLSENLPNFQHKLWIFSIVYLHQKTQFLFKYRIYNDLIVDETGEPDAYLKSINHIDETKFGISGQAHVMFSRIFRIRIYKLFLPNLN